MVFKNLPRQATPFVGRGTELTELIALIKRPDVRLVTILGPGGIGKTRLAIETARQLSQGSGYDVNYAQLQPVESPSFIISAIADALGLVLSGPANPREQLLGALAEKNLTLILDNFEQLLPDKGEALLDDLLAGTSGIKIVVTSRERLNLQDEWLFPLKGMSIPASIEVDGWDTHEAVQLFAQRASRVNRQFSLALEREHVIRICQLVEGLPLAIELAAAWTRSLPCAEIVPEIEHNIDFLTTTLRNVPDRQQSVRAVFDYSWKLLSSQEQQVFQRLAVFRAGFFREAAREVAGATLADLSVFVDKSLLQLDDDGRFQIHELLRQYAREQLVRSPDDLANVYDRHATYFAEFVAQRTLDFGTGTQTKAIQAMESDLENIRAAWEWSAQQLHFENFRKMAAGYSHVNEFNGRYLETQEALNRAVNLVEREITGNEQAELLVILLALQGFGFIRVGQLDNAETAFEKSLRFLKQNRLATPEGFGTDPLAGQALLASIRGDYAKAIGLALESRQNNEHQDLKLNLSISLYVLTDASLAQGDLGGARHYAQEALLCTQETKNRWMMAYIFGFLGHLARAGGDYDQARQNYQASFSIKKEFNDPEGMAVALNHLGYVAWLQKDYSRAEKLFQESLELYRKTGDRGGLARTLNGLGVVTCARDDFPVAQQFFLQALQITSDMEFIPLTLSILVGIAKMMLQLGRFQRGAELLALALDHPAVDRESRDQAKKYLSLCENTLPREQLEAARKRGAAANLVQVVAALQAELAQPLPAGRPSLQPAAVMPAANDQLVEPLTPREMEVLRLIAEGLTNRQIAEQLIIAIGTVKSYTAEIYGKLQVSNRTQAVARAREIKLLD